MTNISIIIPVFNVEKYLSACIDSILAQTYTDFEIILVNDGSTDKSGTICDEYAVKDSRIKVIHKENGGGARGALLEGFKKSSGNYIYMVDSDDYIKPETLETLLHNIQKYDADCVQYQAIYVKDGKETTFHDQKFEIIEQKDLHKQALEDFFTLGTMNRTQWSYGRWDKFYTADVIKKVAPLLDPNITLCEDLEMSLWVALHSKRVVILQDTHLYYWRFLDNSISKGVSENYLKKHIVFFDALKKFADINNLNSDGLGIITDSIWVNVAVTILAKKIPLRQKVSLLKFIRENISSRRNIASLAEEHAFITKYSLKYFAYLGPVLPGLLSNIYMSLKK